MLLSLLFALGPVSTMAQEAGEGAPFASDHLIAFQSFRHGDFSSSILLAAPDGSLEVDLTPREGTEKPLFLEPAYSPDARRIAYVAGGSSGSHLTSLWVMNADRSEARALPSQARRFSSEGRMIPAWSPDGTQLAYTENQGERFEIWLIGLDGEPGRSLTPGKGKSARPCWSPDGERLLFDSDRSGNWEVYVMKADGSGVRRLTEDPAEDVFASWSPDGRRVLFTSDREGPSCLYTMNPEGEDVRRVSPSASKAWNASWSPDGRHIAFVSDREGLKSIWVMTADGTNERRVSSTEFRDGRPTWVRRSVLDDG